MAFISKGLVLTYKVTSNGTPSAAYDAFFTKKNIENKVFPNLQEIGEVSFAGVGGSFDQIEVTTLADARHMYVDGLIADNESNANEISFKFLYDPELFAAFKGQLDKEGSGTWASDDHLNYVITIPSGGSFTIEADISSLAMDSIAINSALTFTLTIAVRSIKMNAEATANA